MLGKLVVPFLGLLGKIGEPLLAGCGEPDAFLRGGGLDDGVRERGRTVVVEQDGSIARLSLESLRVA